MSLLTNDLSLGAIGLASVWWRQYRERSDLQDCSWGCDLAVYSSLRSFNKTLGGQLITPVALGAVCHPHQAAYNNATCATVQN